MGEKWNAYDSTSFLKKIVTYSGKFFLDITETVNEFCIYEYTGGEYIFGASSKFWEHDARETSDGSFAINEWRTIRGQWPLHVFAAA